MKKIYIASCLLSLTLLVGSANAASESGGDLYLSGNLSVFNLKNATYVDSMDNSNYDIHFNTGYGLLASLGYDFGNFRVELEGAYQTSDVNDLNPATGSQYSGKDNSVSSISTMVNGYLDFSNNTPWKSFLMLGGGGSYIDFDAYGDDYAPALQVGAGFGYQFTDHIIADIQYRYLVALDPKNSQGEYEYQHFRFLAGCRYMF